MVDIMSHLHQYVPVIEYMNDVHMPISRENVQVPQAIFHPILFGGGNLRAARARGARRARVNSLTPVTHLYGIIPCAEDWYAQLNLLDITYQSMTKLCSHV